ncbi:MAG TPA: hypothetical protein DEP42_07115 [Ruminococcaceae bacterium]|nr:hypothetical protein [Oscillospiraceae bacterium]
MKPTKIAILEEAQRCLLCHDAPCTKGCPAKSDPASFIRSIRFQNLHGGAKQALQNNPLGSICATLCTSEKYCEKLCIRGKIDHPIHIAALHAFISHQAHLLGFSLERRRAPNHLCAAVLGTNIAAISAAIELALDGVQATIFSIEPLWSTDVLKKLTIQKNDREILNDSMQTLAELNIHVLPMEEARAQINSHALKKFNALIVTSKEVWHEFSIPENMPGIFMTGDLVSGPNDAAFSIRKGRMAAAHTLKFMEEKENA